MKTNREKQAEYKKRMREKGFRFLTVAVLESSVARIKQIEKEDKEKAA